MNSTRIQCPKSILYLSLGFLTFSPTWNLMIKTLSIGRMENFKTFSGMAILVQMFSFEIKTEKQRAILAPTISAPHGIQ